MGSESNPATPNALGLGASLRPGPGTTAESDARVPSQQQRAPAMPQLSCALCRDRKLKCDKLDPCTNCKSSGVVCVTVYRPRLPRGRYAQGGRRLSSPSMARDQGLASDAASLVAANKELTERLQRLESLVTGMSSPESKFAEAQPQRPTSEDTEVAPAALGNITPSPSITSPFSSRDDGNNGLGNDQMEQESLFAHVTSDFNFGDLETTATVTLEPACFDTFDGGMMALGFPGPNGSELPAVRELESVQQKTVTAAHLCQVYIDSIDPIIKILHWPSLSRWMQQGESYMGYPEWHTSVQALRSAVCYSAAVTMTEEQCQDMFKTAKSKLVMVCRTDCEAAISKSGLLSSPDISVLQAFLLYLVAKRAEDSNTAIWALLALVVRVAKALGLHRDVGDGETFFNQQIRKRLWLTICLMDLQTSLCQSSEPLISQSEAASALTLVLNINDSDFDQMTRHPIPNREDLTDITFALITYRVQLAGRVLHFSPTVGCGSGPNDSGGGGGRPTSPSPPPDVLSSREWRQRHVKQFEQEALSLLHFCDPESSNFAWFTWHSTQCLVAAVRFAAVQHSQPLPPSHPAATTTPLHPVADTDAATSGPCSEARAADMELLRRAVSHLEKAQAVHTSPRSLGYRWYVTVPSSTLSAAAAESIACTDAAFLRRAWPVIETSYQRLGGDAVISQGAPLARLMGRMRDKMAALHADASSFQAEPSLRSSVSNTPSLQSSRASTMSWGSFDSGFTNRSSLSNKRGLQS